MGGAKRDVLDSNLVLQARGRAVQRLVRSRRATRTRPTVLRLPAWAAAACGLETAIRAFILLATIPFTHSILHGIGFGFIAFVTIKLLRRSGESCIRLMYGTAAAFAAYFVLG
jgi:hypothetical protein